MTRDLTQIQRKAAEEQEVMPQMSPLIQGILGCMAWEAGVYRLTNTLGSIKRPNLEALRLCGATLSFRNHDGGEDLVLNFDHKDTRLIVEVKTPAGLWDRGAIASNLRSILEGATNQEISFRQLEKSIGENSSATNNQPIKYRATFSFPQGLDSRLLDKAGRLVQRDAEAQINFDKVIMSMIAKSAASGHSSGGLTSKPKIF